MLYSKIILYILNKLIIYLLLFLALVRSKRGFQSPNLAFDYLRKKTYFILVRK